MVFLDELLLKAARSLAGWSAEDLAEASGASISSIRHFESGKGKLSQLNEERVLRALDKAGIEVRADGVRRRERDLVVYDNYEHVLDDALFVLEQGDEILFHRADDRRSTPAVIEKIEALRKAGIACKSTICGGNTFLLGNASDYRWIPEDYFAGGEVEAIYSDRYVIHVPGDRDEFICIRNATVAEAHRREFYYWWNKGRHVEGA
jgi:transcriptional regulator with XRE-family HTH domain